MSDKIVYLDPREVEVDKWNLRFEFPLDREKIEAIKQDLKKGRGIEYHITVREKNGKYYCFVGRNRLIAAKEFIEETGREIKIPAKVINVSDEEALQMSFEENWKRQDLTTKEIAKYIKRRYELWIQKTHKKYSLAAHGGQLILNSDIFSISRFIKECNIPFSRQSVERYLGISELPDELLKIGNGLDVLTLYELTKLDRSEQFKIANVLKNYSHIPQEIRVKALKIYRESSHDFKSILLNLYRDKVLQSCRLIGELDVLIINYLATRYSLKDVGELCKRLEVLKDRVDLSKIDTHTIDGLLRVSSKELVSLNDIAARAGIAIGSDQYIMLLAKYLENPEAVDEFIEEFMESSRTRDEYIGSVKELIDKIINFLSFNPTKYIGIIDVMLRERKYDRNRINQVMRNMYSYLMLSPGFSDAIPGKQKKLETGVMYRLFGREYGLAYEAVKEGLVKNNEASVRKGLETVKNILTEIQRIFDDKWNSEVVNKLKVVRERHTVASDDPRRDIKRLEHVERALHDFEKAIEVYITVRRFIVDVEGSSEWPVYAEKLQKLKDMYWGLLRVLDDFAVYDMSRGFEKIKRYVNNVVKRDEYREVEKYYKLKDELPQLFDDAKIRVSEVPKYFAENYNKVLNELSEEYSEAIEKFDASALEEVRESLFGLMEELDTYSPKLIDLNLFGEKICVKYTGSREKPFEIPYPHQTATFEEEVKIEVYGRKYRIRFEEERTRRIKSIEEVSDEVPELPGEVINPYE